MTDRLRRPTPAARKLAEIWEVDGAYHLRVEVGAFQRAFTPEAAAAEEVATFEVLEVLRKIVTRADAGEIRHAVDSELDQ